MISSSRRIIKAGSQVEEAGFLKFVPPVQNPGKEIPQPEKTASDGENRKRGNSSWNGDDGESYSPATFQLCDPEEASVRQGSRIVESAKAEAQQILMKANAVSENLVKDARKQAEQTRKEAIEEGYRSGYDSGYQAGLDKAKADYGKELEDLLNTFRKDMETALASVEQAKEKCLRTYLDELKDCSVAVAEKVIHISLKSSGEVIKRMIVSATEKLKKTAWVKIYIDKCDYDMMMEADVKIIDELSHLSDNIKFIVMDKEDRGNCIIEMPEEIVDVSVNTQIENIKDILENIRV